MTQDRIQIGVIGRPHGVRGLVHVHSFAADADSLASYGTLTDDRGGAWTLTWRADGIALLRDADGKPVDSREAAQALVNRKLFVTRDTLPEPEPDEFYHSDLIGMEAVENGAVIGRIVTVHDYGAGASLELDSGSVIPFTLACVPEVDLASRRVTVSRPNEVVGEEEHASKRDREAARAAGGAA
ncbi:16S rRNA processing protein RimM [Acetobacter sacchari]|uniref:Ribosome maturation factor RimM n=1 Tax=Acetobacter sacchari TaxID=2661687 RepID=A0ABS3LQS1_9PROT|nr:ribosome maturation factor RimM [Acetobacter sacchari]MBO1358262.1 16S rRNA processing protein RimM [Acetobacter sacchari]